jgi:hypothetical protein
VPDKPASAVEETQASPAVEPEPTPPDPLPARVEIGVETVDPDQWLFVEGIRDGVPGGWATGSFDPERNKLSIRTHDLRGFAVDVARIPIRWEKLVILSIDGRNSELRRRDFTLLHFRLDEHGQWVVADP